MENKDQLTSRGAMAAFLFPPIGLINSFRYKDTKPNTAKASIKIALFSIALMGAGSVINALKSKKQSLSGIEVKHVFEAYWQSKFITVPLLKVKFEVPCGPKTKKNVFVEIEEDKITFTDENGMIINF